MDNKNQSRRQFIQTIGATSVASIAGSFLPTIAFAQSAAQFSEFTLKYANNLPTTHPMNLRAKAAAEAIKRDTHGRVDLQIFPNNQMGSDTAMLTQVRSGAIDCFTVSGLLLSTLVPAASINGIGFAFENYDKVWAAMDGDVGKYVRDAISNVGLLAMDKIWDNGYRHITSSTKPIVTPADLQGFKIRVPVSPLWTSMFKVLGAAPTGINFSELYPALQTKVVDGQENPLALIQTARIYEVQKYCSLTGHMWDGFWFLVNKKSWDQLPKDLQAIVAKHINAAGLAERSDVAALNKSAENWLQENGLKINRPDIKPFRAVLQKAGFYSEWHKNYGSDLWHLLEQYTGRLS